MANRAARRAAARGKGKQMLAGFQFLLTPDEAVVVEEALDAYIQDIHRTLDGDEPGVATGWALERAEKIRQAMLAAIEGRPYRDMNPQRFQPRPDEIKD